MSPRGRRRVPALTLVLPAALLALLALSGCGERGLGPAPGAPGGPPAVELALEPSAPLDAAPLALRVHARAEGALDPGRIVLVAGDVGSAQLGQLERQEVSEALALRIVPSLAWVAPGEPGHVVLAPSVALEPGARYTVASGAPRFATALVATTSSALPLLLWAWPPRGAGADATLAVWCGASPLPALAAPTVLEPGGPTGTLERGAVSAEGGTACARFVADPDGGAESGATGNDGPFAAPLRLAPDSDAPLALLEPGELAAAVPVPEPVAPLACQDTEIAFGPGCARVADDRLLVRAPGAPLLWSVSGGERDWVRPTAALEPFVLAPLAPGSELALVVQTLDVAGRTTRADVTCTTPAPAPHLVVHEVLANPVGAEPAQEWVELYNDGLVPAALGGLALVDPGDTVILPDAVLPPGGFALVVNQAFDDTPPFDVPPAPGTLLLRVSGLTLTNQGDPLLLEDANGVELSRFDPAVKPKSGRSVMRVAPAAPDGWPASFALAVTPTPGAPNAPP